jgi:excisionase family DNA binding protein
MMTVQEVAASLKVSAGMIYREIYRRRLSCYRIGGAIRISAEHLQAYLQLAESQIQIAPSTFKHVKRIGG